MPARELDGPAHLSTLEDPYTRNRSREFRENLVWTLCANFFYAACQWLMLVVLARVSSPTQVGLFALGLAITAPIIMFANLQLRSVQVTDGRGAFQFGEYLGLRGVSTVAAICVITGIAGLLALQSHSLESAAVIVVLGASKALEAFSDVIHGHLQQRERMVFIARSIMLKGVVSLLFVILALTYSTTALAAASAVAGASALVLLIYDLPVTARIIRIDGLSLSLHGWLPSRRMASLAALALPLGIVQALVSLNANIPRYFLEQSFAPAELGIFAALASFVVVGQTIVSALGNVASPRLAQHYSEGRHEQYRLLLLRIIGVGMCVGLAGLAVSAVFGRRILLLLFSPEYATFANDLVVLMIGATAAYIAWFAGFGLTAAHLFSEQIPLLVTVSIGTWLASAFLIPKYGVTGAAFAFTVSMSLQAAGALLILWYGLRFRNRAANHAS